MRQHVTLVEALHNVLMEAEASDNHSNVMNTSCEKVEQFISTIEDFEQKHQQCFVCGARFEVMDTPPFMTIASCDC